MSHRQKNRHKARHHSHPVHPANLPKRLPEQVILEPPAPTAVLETDREAGSGENAEGSTERKGTLSVDLS